MNEPRYFFGNRLRFLALREQFNPSIGIRLAFPNNCFWFWFSFQFGHSIYWLTLFKGEVRTPTSTAGTME